MGSGARILVVDDDADMLHLISLRLTAAGYQVSEADSGEAALLCFRENRPQLVVTDLRMGGMDGLALFKHLQSEAQTLPVIILTAHGTIPDAVAATQRGVFSFLTKPFDGRELLRRVADAIRLSPILDPEHAAASWRSDLVTVSVRMEEVLRQALRISEESKTALLVGAAGSGKTLLAQTIHGAGPRANRPLVTVSCTDFPESDLEEMLSPDNPDGVFAQATGGLLYLQDISALSLVAQARLYSVLFAQQQASNPLHRLNLLSGQNEMPDVQIIASSPRPLDGAVAEGMLRSDLFYLLSSMTLIVPPLSADPAGKAYPSTFSRFSTSSAGTLSTASFPWNGSRAASTSSIGPTFAFRFSFPPPGVPASKVSGKARVPEISLAVMFTFS